MRYFEDGRDGVEQLELTIGDRLKLEPDARRWWTVQAVSEHFAACVRQAPFEAAGVLEYTVLDWRNGVRGPCDLIGQGYGDGSYSGAECDRMLAEFEQPRDGDSWGLQVSQRNWTRLRVLERRPAIVGGGESRAGLRDESAPRLAP
jgi:hypothetical protein